MKHLFIAIAGLILLPPFASAFPPAPQHLFFGMVRDEYGNPLEGQAEVVLESAGGKTIRASIAPNTSPGVNYQLVVPMDAGLTGDSYKATAMRPTLPFKMKVKIGNVAYLPIEMSGDFSNMGQPGERTRLNLTLGEDLNGNGIPDAWERAMAQRWGITPEDFRPEDDANANGLSNLEEYLAGTYAFNNPDGFALTINNLPNGRPTLEFLGIRGRSYIILGSDDLSSWSAIQFRLSGQSDTVPARDYHYAPQVGIVQVEPVPSEQRLFRFYKLMVQ